MARPRILIIDDDRQNLTLLREILGSRYDVETSWEPQEGLNKALAAFPDLMILDIDMPKMSGFDVCEAVRAAPGGANIPVIFVTADPKASSMQRALQLGANDYLTKPFRAAELLKRLETRLGQAHVDVPIQKGNLLLDPGDMSVTITVRNSVHRVRVTHRGFQILHALLKNEERVLSREQLLNDAWKGGEVSDRAVDLQIFRLRRALKRWNHVIEAIYGQGYAVRKRRIKD